MKNHIELGKQGWTQVEDEVILSELYHENSKQQRHDTAFGRRIAQVNSSAELHRVIARTFKSYPGALVTPLPRVEPADGPGFETVALARRSVRRFSGAPLSLRELSRLVYFANGLTGRLKGSDDSIAQPVRAAPSGGALYPVEIYIALMAVEGLESGLYHYAVDRHGIELLQPGQFVGRLSETTSDQATFSQAAMVFILTGVFRRAHFKYGERAYRFTLLEAGHIGQNILLAATALQLGAVPVGGFVDDEVNQLLGLDGVDEAAIYLVAIGHAAHRPPTVATDQAVVDRLLGAFWGRDADWQNE